MKDLSLSLTRRDTLRTIFAAGVTAAVASSPQSARADDPLRVAVVPEVATTPTSYSDKQPLVDFLHRATGRDVKLLIPTNYAATVEAIGNDGVDLAYFGALTYCQARARYDVRPVVQRLQDRSFHSLFITTNPAIGKLADLKGKTFAFGDVSSTSGHLIPAKEMLAARLDLDHDIRARFTGNHTATALAVDAGQVDAGALDESVYRKLVTDGKIDGKKTRVFVTSAPFVDYVWAVAKSVDDHLAGSIRAGFLGLHDRAVLDLLRATTYVAANDREYDEIRTVAKQLNLL